ncbi:MFS transporter [Kitasatospora purpeofusca]|uniref:MFS transporter n=1 Tax=Kitasatospora purpeofusca TaxID=67352 RepID=UPI002A5AF131|nr:MFS transporter [Kitasatospora purpeofusca]MDY0815819.1 MFS transporter [Kitasatospora purpeofusca]
MSHHTEVRGGPPPLPYRWTILGVATFTQAASCFFVQGIGAMAVPLQNALDLSTAQLGLLLSASQLAPLVGLLVAGELLDRYGERWVVGIGAGVVAAGLLAGSTAQGYASLLVVLLVVGAGYSAIQPGGSKSVAAWFEPARLGFAMGVRQAGLPLGGAVAVAVLPVVAAASGWRVAVLVGGLVALTGAVAFTALYRRPPGTVAKRPAALGPVAAGPVAAGPVAAGPVAAGPVAAPLMDRLRLLREPAMTKALLSGTAMVSVHSGIGVLGALYLHDVTALGTGAAGAVLVAAQMAGMLGRIGLAAWSDRSRAGRYRPVLASMVGAATALVALATPLGGHPLAAAVLFAWLGFFGIGWYGPWVAHLAEAAPPGRTGFALGLVMAVNQVAVILAPPALGLLRDATGGYTAAWSALAVATAGTAAATARSGKRRGSTTSRPGRPRPGPGTDAAADAAADAGASRAGGTATR